MLVWMKRCVHNVRSVPSCFLLNTTAYTGLDWPDFAAVVVLPEQEKKESRPGRWCHALPDRVHEKARRALCLVRARHGCRVGSSAVRSDFLAPSTSTCISRDHMINKHWVV